MKCVECNEEVSLCICGGYNCVKCTYHFDSDGNINSMAEGKRKRGKVIYINKKGGCR